MRAVTVREPTTELIALGAYTPRHGRATGIGLMTFEPPHTGHALDTIAACDSPSFLAAHPSVPVVYAVHEFEQTVAARIRTSEHGQLRAFGDAVAAGAAACHVAVDPAGTMLVVCCWGDGQVLSYGLGERGEIISRFAAEPAAAHPKPGPGHAEPLQSRAHAALFLPDGRVLTTDLGLDRVRVWRKGAGAELLLDHEVALETGTGPRHMALHPAGFVYIVGEYSIEVSVLATDANGRFSVIQSAPVLARDRADGDAAAEISLNTAATRLYVTVRGSDLIATLEVDGTGRITRTLDARSCGGGGPRHHLLHEGGATGSHLHIANENSDTVVTFAIDDETGLPGAVLDVLTTPSPTCLLELPLLA